MGKGTIVGGGDEGLYTTKLEYNTDSYEAESSALDSNISSTESAITTLENITEPTKSEISSLKSKRLQLVSLQKRKVTIDAIHDEAEAEEVSIWCADFTEDLTGEVGTIEVPGEKVIVQIQPGFDDVSDYNQTRDGQLFKTALLNKWAAYYNLAMLPGWQKWKPTYRHGTIFNISDNLCEVTLEVTKSTQQSLDVNQEIYLEDVPIEYMTCDGGAFESGDEVLVQFIGQDFANPKVIGFKEYPKECLFDYFIIYHDVYLTLFAYNLEEETITIPRVYYPLEAGETERERVVFPVLTNDFTFWFEDKQSITSEDIFEPVPGEPTDTGAFGPGSTLACPIYPVFINRYTSGVEHIGGCYNSGRDCLYWYCESFPDPVDRAFSTTDWVDEEGNEIDQAHQISYVEHNAWTQEASPGDNNYARRSYIAHGEVLDYYSYKGWSNLMDLGADKVGMITSKDRFVQWDYEIISTAAVAFTPTWFEYDHTLVGSIDNTMILTDYTKTFPMNIPDIVYQTEETYVANNYTVPGFHESVPDEYYDFKGEYSRDIVVSILAYRMQTTRTIETVPETYEVREIVPKTLASITYIGKRVIGHITLTLGRWLLIHLLQVVYKACLI